MKKIASLLFAVTLIYVTHLLALTPAERSTAKNERLMIEYEPIKADTFAMYREIVSLASNRNPMVIDLYERLEETVQKIAGDDPHFCADLVLQAAAFAADKHEGQTKSVSNLPYIMHPLSVALILIEEGKVTDHSTLAAALLHDTLEDTDTTIEELAYLFSEPVAVLVQEVTNDPHLTVDIKHDWILEHVKTISFTAKLIKLADRTHNLRFYNELNKRDPSLALGKKSFIASIELVKILSGVNEGLETALRKEIDLFFDRKARSVSSQPKK